MTVVKKTAIALATVAAMSTAAHAGGMDEPVMEPEIIVEETSTGTGGGWVVPVVLLAVIAAVAAAN
jgi:hypothetical protein